MDGTGNGSGLMEAMKSHAQGEMTLTPEVTLVTDKVKELTIGEQWQFLAFLAKKAAELEGIPAIQVDELFSDAGGADGFTQKFGETTPEVSGLVEEAIAVPSEHHLELIARVAVFILDGCNMLDLFLDFTEEQA